MKSTITSEQVTAFSVNYFTVGDSVKALAYTDCFGKFHPEIRGLVVDDVRFIPEAHGVAAYCRLNCTERRYRSMANDVIRVEAAARFFEKESPCGE